MRRVLLSTAALLSLAPLSVPTANAAPAPYETAWPDNCKALCVFPYNVSSALLMPDRRVKLTMRATCSPTWVLPWDAQHQEWHGFIPGLEPRFEVTLTGLNGYFPALPGHNIGQPEYTWNQDLICDGSKHTYTHTAPSTTRFLFMGGRAVVAGRISWYGGWRFDRPGDGWSWWHEDIVDWVRIKRP